MRNSDVLTVEIQSGQQRFTHLMAWMTGLLESSMALLGRVVLDDFDRERVTLDMNRRVVEVE